MSDTFDALESVRRLIKVSKNPERWRQREREIMAERADAPKPSNQEP